MINPRDVTKAICHGCQRRLGSGAAEAGACRLEALRRLLADDDAQVRFDSALTLARIGPAAAEAIPDLQRSLRDENRYVRANAVEALNRIGTAQAQRILIDYLLGARWCYSTTPESLF